MVVLLLLCGIGILFAMCAACFYRMGAADWADEKKFLFDSLESLESQNAKLRNQVDNLLDFEHLTSVAVAYAGCDECGEYKQTMLRLFAENAKLLRLLQDACGYINHPADATWTHVKRKEVRDSIGDRMRELGVN